jgi:hypothetical protein
VRVRTENGVIFVRNLDTANAPILLYVVYAIDFLKIFSSMYPLVVKFHLDFHSDQHPMLIRIYLDQKQEQ